MIELTRTNGYLLQELAYYKDIQAADMKFFEKVIKTHAELKDALKERSQRRANAESTLLSYWGIDFGDGNVEDTVFWYMLSVVLLNKTVEDYDSNPTHKGNCLIAGMISPLRQKWPLRSNKDGSVRVFSAVFW